MIINHDKEYSKSIRTYTTNEASRGSKWCLSCELKNGGATEAKGGGGRRPRFRQQSACADAVGGEGHTGPGGWGWRPGQELDHAGTFLEEYRPKLYVNASKKLGSGRRKTFPQNSSPSAPFRSWASYMS